MFIKLERTHIDSQRTLPQGRRRWSTIAIKNRIISSGCRRSEKIPWKVQKLLIQGWQTWKKEVLSKELFIQCRPVGSWQVWRGMGWHNTSTDQSHTIIYRRQEKICILFKSTECQHRLICPFLSFCPSAVSSVNSLPPYLFIAISQTWFGHHTCLWLTILNISHQLQARYLFILLLQAELKWSGIATRQTVISCPANS